MADSLHVALDNTTFTNNSAQVTTGGVSLAPSATSSELLSLLAVNVTFTSKSAGQSGGLCANASDVRLIDCVSENNTATGDSAEGFNAHWIKFLLLDGCSFNYNQAVPILAAPSMSHIALSQATWRQWRCGHSNRCFAEQGVGGVSVDGVTMFLIDTCTFGQNIGGNGAAVAVNSTVIPGTCKQAQDCAALVTSSTFVQNTHEVLQVHQASCLHGGNQTVTIPTHLKSIPLLN
ncbi:hypothetical protein WJX77_005218 [Trebouxia sp. C0004]